MLLMNNSSFFLPLLGLIRLLFFSCSHSALGSLGVKRKMLWKPWNFFCCCFLFIVLTFNCHIWLVEVKWHIRIHFCLDCCVFFLKPMLMFEVKKAKRRTIVRDAGRDKEWRVWVAHWEVIIYLAVNRYSKGVEKWNKLECVEQTH